MSVANWNDTAFYRIGDVVQRAGVDYIATADNHDDAPPSASWAVYTPPSPTPTQPSVSLFDYQDFTPFGLLPLPDFPSRVVVQTMTYTPPTNGTLYMECIARLLGTEPGASALFTFSVNGTLVNDTTPVVAQTYAPNTNFVISTMYQINVVAGTSYLVDVVGSCSALPPATPDALVFSSRLMLLFTPV